MNYMIRCKKGDKTVRTIKDVKGHQFMANVPGLLMVHLENDERVFINFNNFDFLDFSNGWAKGEAVAAQAAAKAAEAKDKNGNPPPPVINGPGGAS